MSRTKKHCEEQCNTVPAMLSEQRSAPASIGFLSIRIRCCSAVFSGTAVKECFQLLAGQLRCAHRCTVRKANRCIIGCFVQHMKPVYRFSITPQLVQDLFLPDEAQQLLRLRSGHRTILQFHPGLLSIRKAFRIQQPSILCFFSVERSSHNSSPYARRKQKPTEYLPQCKPAVYAFLATWLSQSVLPQYNAEASGSDQHILHEAKIIDIDFPVPIDISPLLVSQRSCLDDPLLHHYNIRNIEHTVAVDIAFYVNGQICIA